LTKSCFPQQLSALFSFPKSEASVHQATLDTSSAQLCRTFHFLCLSLSIQWPLVGHSYSTQLVVIGLCIIQPLRTLKIKHVHTPTFSCVIKGWK
jgi:hypothetical protein